MRLRGGRLLARLARAQPRWRVPRPPGHPVVRSSPGHVTGSRGSSLRSSSTPRPAPDGRCATSSTSRWRDGCRVTTTSGVSPREWSVPPSDVLLADGTIAVIRTLTDDDREAVLRPPRARLRGHPAAAVLHREPQRRPPVRRPAVRPGAHRAVRAGRAGPRPPRGAGDGRGALRGAGRGRLPRLRPGPRTRSRQPAARAPGRAGPRARAEPLRRRRARRQLRDAPGLPRRRLLDRAADRSRRGVRRAAHRRVRRRSRRLGPARVAIRGALAAAAARARERRRGRRTPVGRGHRPSRARLDRRGRVRRAAVGRAPRGRRRGRHDRRGAGVPERAGRARPARPGHGRGATRRGGRGDRRRLCGRRGRGRRRVVGLLRDAVTTTTGTWSSSPGPTASGWSARTPRACSATPVRAR